MSHHFIELTREDNGVEMIVNTEHITHICHREPAGSTIYFVGDQAHPKGIHVKESFPHLNGGELKEPEIVPSADEIAAKKAADAAAKAAAKEAKVAEAAAKAAAEADAEAAAKETGADDKSVVSPVADQNAHDAIDHISRMVSREKLELIRDSDQRVSVKDAAQKRLDSLPA